MEFLCIAGMVQISLTQGRALWQKPTATAGISQITLHSIFALIRVNSLPILARAILLLVSFSVCLPLLSALRK